MVIFCSHLCAPGLQIGEGLVVVAVKFVNHQRVRTCLAYLALGVVQGPALV